MNQKAKWAILIVVLLALLGGGLYYFLNKKYYPKIEDVSYLTLDLTNDTAQVKAGVQVQNRVPLSITVDSIHYTVNEGDFKLGWGQMMSAHTLPPLGDKVLDFKMLLQLERFREHLKKQEEQDSITLDVKADVFFDVPILSPKSITIDRQLTVAVPKSPSLQVKDLVVRHFSVDSGYSFLLKLNATNRNLPNVSIQDFRYTIKIDDSLTITGQVDSSFQLQPEGNTLEVPLELETSDAIALVNKVLSGDKKWNYHAQVQAQVSSSHRLFNEFELKVVKDGVIPMGNMGDRSQFMPKVKQVKRLEVDSNEEQTLLQAAVVVHNPAPIPFYIDSASYFIRYKGKVIASGRKDYEKILQKSGDALLNLRLLIDESAYEQFMQQVQGQEKVNLDLALNLLYNLPGAEKQSIQVRRQVQVPVPGQSKIQVKDLIVRELSPKKGALLALKLQVQSTNLPDLSIQNLDYTLHLGEDLTITGQTKEPITVGGGDNTVEIPLHLSAEDVNQLLNKALKGTIDWNYDLKATAEIRSSHDMVGPTKVNLEFTGELEMGKGMAGKKFVPHLTKIDTLDVVINYDTAWVKLNIHVKNPLPVSFKVDSLLLTLSHENKTFATIRESVGKILPAEGTQSAWITLKVNYGLWKEFIYDRQGQDSLQLQETITLVYQLEDLAQQRTTFQNPLMLPTPQLPVTKLGKVTFRGFSFTNGLLLNAQVEVNNLSVDKLVVERPFYSVCVENLLDVCATVQRTYHVPKGKNTVTVPMSLGIGEMFRAFFAKLTSKGESRNIYLMAEAVVTTGAPLLQNTFLKLKIWKKEVVFPKKNQKDQVPAPEQTAAK